ncbi:hypothetical protein [Candidatus Amarolinea dominans]|uniref:hypothetical protein n=1 Tax=Candidatus Amarolinea dominans TaxID=3140696 RepID=UPI001D34BEC7|nr:hypothetical protein [Anaerolineae bacterium]
MWSRGYTNAKGEAVAGLGGGFRYCRLGEPLFDADGQIRETVTFAELARHVYFTETGEPLPRGRVLEHAVGGRLPRGGVYLLYNGILGDKPRTGGNVLTRGILARLPNYDGQKVIYCAGCRLGHDRQNAGAHRHPPDPLRDQSRMIPLKDYQDRVLGLPADLLPPVRRQGRPDAYSPHPAAEQDGEPVPYLPVSAAGLAAGMPCVCLRVPTGGGKTLLACHAAGLAMTDLLRAERAVVLWLVPSNTILDQTVDALRDPRHPYRRAWDWHAPAPVEVMRIEEALRLSPAPRWTARPW